MDKPVAFFPNRTTIPTDLATALDQLVAYLWEDEKNNFTQAVAAQKKGHVFTSLAIIKKWLEGGEYVE